MNTDSFFMHIRTEDVYEDIANDVKKNSLIKLRNRKSITNRKKLKSNCTNESCIR